jgi:hypothetical protein
MSRFAAVSMPSAPERMKKAATDFQRKISVKSKEENHAFTDK